ncbi:hypothetical protein BFJ71_g9698 [Fusarium oxysporum]|nr:hypothetical protein BFJ71_g9698 [Fusarium oxysporum]
MRPTPPYHQVNELSLICSQPTGHGSPGRLDEELSMGADPNSQPEKARELLSAIEPGWDGRDPPPQFEEYGEQFQPPIYCAASHLNNSTKGKSEKAQMVFPLLRHGDDLYQEFPQALYSPDRSSKPRAPFPGEDPPCTSFPEFPTEANSLDWEEENQHPHFSDDEWENEERAPAWGARHVIHAIIEDGGCLTPLIEYPGFLASLNLEHRDPQGRTLLLSACRSAAGADPDKHGTYPLHAALRRMRLYPDPDYMPAVRLGEPLGCVQEILRMGADPRAKDGKGNTALYYLDDDDLTGVWLGTGKRQIFYELLKDGCSQDINMPNNAGRTVAEFIFDDNGRMEDEKMGNHGECSRSHDADFRNWQDVDHKVFTALDDAGIDWRAKTSESGNLLHLVARSGLSQERLIWRSQFLVDKGIDPTAPDADVWTARKIAEHYILNKFRFYEELGKLERGGVEVEWQ